MFPFGRRRARHVEPRRRLRMKEEVNVEYIFEGIIEQGWLKMMGIGGWCWSLKLEERRAELKSESECDSRSAMADLA
jgi:hypothetical protein